MDKKNYGIDEFCGNTQNKKNMINFLNNRSKP
jgi:hypothetical protein